MGMTIAQRVVLDLLGQTLFQVPFDPKNYNDGAIDWAEVYRESHKQTVAQTVAEAVPAAAEQGLRMQWIEDCCELERRGYQVLLAHQSLYQLLQKHQIPSVFLKGFGSGTYYPALHLRKYGDVDFLIDPEIKDRVKAALKAEGFTEGKELPYECSFEKDSVSYDVHYSVNGVPTGGCGEAIREAMSELAETAVLRPLNGSMLPVPNDFHHGMILLLHTAKHLVSFGAGLRQLCDWAVFANQIGNDFPNLFEEKLKAAGLWRFAQVMSFACVKYMHMPMYAWIAGTDEELTARFMEDLMRKGSLQHDGDDDMSALLVKESNQGGVGKKNMLVLGLRNLKDNVCYQWPVMKKIKILIPFGIFWMCVRYVRGVLTGSYKKSNIRETLSNAAKRKKLYEELSMFSEVEL